MKCPKVKLLTGAVLIIGKRYRLHIYKENILEEYHDVFIGVGELPRKEYHITLKRNYVAVQQQCTKGSSNNYVMKESSHLYRSIQKGPTQ